MGLRNWFLIGGVGLLAMYLNYPAPEVSKELQDWVRGGKFFDHNGHKIFYRSRWKKAIDVAND